MVEGSEHVKENVVEIESYKNNYSFAVNVLLTFPYFLNTIFN